MARTRERVSKQRSDIMPRAKAMSNEAEVIERSGGNVFADLGMKEPATKLAKAELARRIGDLLAERGLTQSRAAEVLGIDQPKVSALLRGKLEGFSVDRLFRLLNALGSDVEIAIRPTREGMVTQTRVVGS
jgi:predicted XRE-type DNA-binding protein